MLGQAVDLVQIAQGDQRDRESMTQSSCVEVRPVAPLRLGSLEQAEVDEVTSFLQRLAQVDCNDVHRAEGNRWQVPDPSCQCWRMSQHELPEGFGVLRRPHFPDVAQVIVASFSAGEMAE